MIAVLTGDIVRSQDAAADSWMESLQQSLKVIGKKGKDWEIFRGDSFQLRADAISALEKAVFIKSMIKQIKGLDVRMAIGIGAETFTGETVSTSQGSAFVHSGTAFEDLKKRLLSIKTPWSEVDEQLNLMFDLAGLTINNWTPTTAILITATLQNASLTQVALAAKLGRHQGNISEGLSRGGFAEMMDLVNYYRKLISIHVKPLS